MTNIKTINTTPILSEAKCRKLWKEIQSFYNKFLKDKNVKNIRYGTCKSYQLICLYSEQGNFVHKDAISDFVFKHCDVAGKDQQVRHLNTQMGWYVTNKGQEVNNVTTPSGYHMLVSLREAAPGFVNRTTKRTNILSSNTFSELKKAYNNKCVCCGIEEGKIDERTSKKVKLQQGHKDPNRSLSIDNCIPQCEYCNQTNKDYFVYDENGKILKLNNVNWILSHITDETKEQLKQLIS